MAIAKSITAKFIPRKTKLTINILGLAGHSGSVISTDGRVSCGKTCTIDLDVGEKPLELTAKPDAGF